MWLTRRSVFVDALRFGLSSWTSNSFSFRGLQCASCSFYVRESSTTSLCRFFFFQRLSFSNLPLCCNVEVSRCFSSCSIFFNDDTKAFFPTNQESSCKVGKLSLIQENRNSNFAGSGDSSEAFSSESSALSELSDCLAGNMIATSVEPYPSFPVHKEPTLEDLDRSVPQVDCEFMAALVRYRSFQRSQFLRKRTELKERVASLTENVAPSVSETSHFARLGGFGFWRSGSAQESSFKKEAVCGDEQVLSSEPAVVVAPEVLSQLSLPEKDLLYSTRPEYEDGFLLLDCRTVNEVTSWGLIEGAKVLPAHEIFAAFHLTPLEFEETFGFRKPEPDNKIICYCQYGPRSLMAAQLLSWFGYLKVLHFREGYYEWGKQYNLLLRRWMEHDKKSGNELRRMATFRAALELQRDVAPEFNKLPMEEAAAYRLDTSRSSGKLRIGDGLRAEAFLAVASLADSLPLLEGSTEEGGLIEKSSLTGEQQLSKFLSQATGIDPEVESTYSNTFSFNDAQEAALQHSTKEHIDPFSSK